MKSVIKLFKRVFAPKKLDKYAWKKLSDSEVPEWVKKVIKDKIYRTPSLDSPGYKIFKVHGKTFIYRCKQEYHSGHSSQYWRKLRKKG